MREYPSIGKEQIHNKWLFIYNKLDGNNIRAGWNNKKGFYKYGSRHAMFDQTDKVFGGVIDLIQDKYGKDLDKLFKGQGYEKVTCFFEYYSDNSSFGRYIEEPHQVTLFDIAIHDGAIMFPREFQFLFRDIETAKLIYEGKFYGELFQQIKDSLLEDVTFEGVVCKAAGEKGKDPLMFKIKTQAWLDKLKEHCGTDEKLFEKLV